MVHAQFLRSHLYHGSDVLPQPLHILEKCKLLDGLSNYQNAYREVLKLASTPLPFTMIQMGRTFLFLWTFTMPFALVTVIDGIISVLIFVFFLTYGFIGLEFVSMQLLHPFGDGINDINIVGMGEAVVYGMGSDSRLVLESPTSKRGGSQRKNLDDSFLAPDHSQSTMGSGDQVGDHDQAAHYYAFHS
jgi:predicted membrane chloride channel (bestrophin family)